MMKEAFKWRCVENNERIAVRRINVVIGREELLMGAALLLAEDEKPTIKKSVARAVKFVEDYGLAGQEAWRDHLPLDGSYTVLAQAEEYVSRFYGERGERL